MSLKIFAELIDDATQKQILTLHQHPHYQNQKIRIMPDCHLGKGSCIGFTQQLSSSLVNPAFVGVDIGCGVSMLIFTSDKPISLCVLDDAIKTHIPHGMERNPDAKRFERYAPNSFKEELAELCQRLPKIDLEDVKKSLCSLGGGNHFIELGHDQQDNTHVYYLTVHSGSRNFGLKVANHYIRQAQQNKPDEKSFRAALNEKIQLLKATGQQEQIESLIRRESTSETCVWSP